MLRAALLPLAVAASLLAANAPTARAQGPSSAHLFRVSPPAGFPHIMITNNSGQVLNMNWTFDANGRPVVKIHEPAGGVLVFPVEEGGRYQALTQDGQIKLFLL